MKIKLTLRTLALLALLLSTLISQPSTCFAQGTAFTYQGRLTDDTNPANGTYDLRSALFDAATVGSQVGSALTNAPVNVSNGLFTVTLDFGANFPGAGRWLELGVRTNGGGAFTTLSPRQQLTATPYSITASNLTGNLSAGQLTGTIASGNLPASPNFSGTVTANAFSGNGAGVTNVNAATLGGLASSNFWKTAGNAGTTAGTHFLGTVDNQPLEIKVNGLRALRLEPNSGGPPNVIAGSAGNFVAAGVTGATIGGGVGNTIATNSSSSTIAGGEDNDIRTNSKLSAIGGGYNNIIAAGSVASTIAGGEFNIIGTNSATSVIGGGYDNDIAANSDSSTIAGGFRNDIGTNSPYSAVGGGYYNDIAAGSVYSTIAGGAVNEIGTNSPYSAIGGGYDNNIASNLFFATIAGGAVNEIGTSSDSSAIGGGNDNNIGTNSQYATIPGGRGNAVAGDYTFAAGRRAKANHTGAFVWADSQNADFSSTFNNQFLIRATGGVGINTNNPQSALHVHGTVIATNFSGSGAGLTGLSAAALNSGNVSAALALTNAGNSFTGNGANLTALNASQLTTGTVPVAALSNAWRIGGNAGTTAGTHFLGTTDNQPLEIKVNGLRALRLEPNTNGAPNLIAGSPRNFVGAGVVGATIAGGGATNYFGTAYTNSVLSDFGVVGGGRQNYVNSTVATIAGGNSNDIGTNSFGSAIGGGNGNSIAADSPVSTIAGGQINDIGTSSDYSAIGGGRDNNIAANSPNATIAGGCFNNIGTNTDYSAIGGGYYNKIAANSERATIAGGFINDIGAGSYSCTIGGGYDNNIAANSVCATIPGGDSNTATNHAFAAGTRAKANHTGTFVWADSTDADFASTGNDEFNVRATGGVNFDDNTSLFCGSNVRQMLNLFGTTYGLGVQGGTLYQRTATRFSWFEDGVHSNTQNDPGAGGTVLMTLLSSGLTVNGTFVSASDRNAKENFNRVNPAAVLAKVVALPLTEWNYKTDEDKNRHMGPMAQDFYAAFGVGPDDKHIAMVDADGVALAAIQGLNQKVESGKQKAETRMEKLEAENTELKARMEKLEHLMSGKNGGAK